MNPNGLAALKTSTLFTAKKTETLGDSFAEPPSPDEPEQEKGHNQGDGKKEKYIVDKVEHVNST